LNPLPEGTHGVQGLDLLGRKVVLDGGAGLALLVATIGATLERAVAAGGQAAEHAAELAAAVERVRDVTVTLWSADDVAVTLANSSVYLEAVGHVVVAWMWLEQELAAGARTGDLPDGKRAAARYFFRYELPRTGPQLDLLASLDRTTLEMREEWY
ncbi:MAG: acyl-CoA dehydrogenase C-terminal domain-containing protein, partial [Pseudonocardia sp.]